MDYDRRLDCFLLTDGSYMDLVQLRAKDLTSTNTDEIEMDCFKWAKYHKTDAADVKYIFSTFPCNTTRQQQYWQQKITKNKNPAFDGMLRTTYEELVYREKHAITKEYYMMVFAKNEDELKNSRRQMEAILQTGRFGLITFMEEKKKTQILYKLANKNVNILQQDEPEKTEGNAEDRQKALLRFLAPAGGMYPDISYVRTGTGYEACVHIYELPNRLEDYWMSRLDAFENTITTIDFRTEDIVEVKKNLNKAIEEQASRKNVATNYQEYFSAEKRELEMKKLFEEIDSMGEVVKTACIRVYVAEKTLEQLEKSVADVITKLGASEFKAAVFLNESKNEWVSMYEPLSVQEQKPHILKGNPMESKLIAVGNPFHFSSLEDPYGSFLGYTPCDGNVVFDAFHKTNTRVNYSAAILGKQRYGKSTLLKKQMKERAQRGDFVRCFDVTGEFTELTTRLGGRVFNMDGTDGIINLLEIFKAGENDHVNYSQHWTKLKNCFLFLKPSASPEEINVFHDLIDTLYEQYGLSPAKGRQITGLAARRYPRFSDLYKLIEEQMNELLNGTYTEIEKELVLNRLTLLDNIKQQILTLIHTYGYLFDGYTSMDNMMDIQIVTYNLVNLKEEDPAIFDLQIYNLTTLCWAGLVVNGSLMKDKWESGEIELQDVIHYLILIDESHRWVNANKIFVLQALSAYMRECPKYFGAFYLATHSIRDFVPDESTKEGVELLKIIFELMQYKFIFHQDSNAIPIFEKVFNSELTYAQKERIPFLQMGETILCISGEENVEFKVYLTNAEKQLFKGGA